MEQLVDQPGGGRESGFTLVEVLVAVVIEAMIVAALGAAFVVILETTSTTNQSLTRSTDARTAAAYIVSDARNSSGPETSLTDTTSCADPSPPVAGTPTPVVRFDWMTTASTGATSSDIVEYMVVANSLVRRECQAGQLVSDHALATNISGVSAVCAPIANCTGTPSSVTVSILELADSAGNQYQYSLTGSFQKAFGDGAPVATTPQPIILLGSGSTCVSGATALSMTTSSRIRVYGNAVMDGTDHGSCTAMNMTTSARFSAGSTQLLSGGSCVDSTSAVCPTTTSFSPAIADPYASLAAPSAAALGLTAQSGCSGGKAYPGVYASTLSISVSNSCQLQPGVYILNNGISVTTSAHLTSAGGVLLYIAGGSFQSSTSATIDISAQTTNPWAGIAIWQAKTDTSTLSFSTSGSVNIDGFIYAPKAAVNMSTSASNPTVSGIVVQNIIMTTSANLVIGTPSTTPLSMGAPPLTSWPVNQMYAATLTASGGDGNYIWAASNLPAGLSMDPDSGSISGTPTAVGAKSVTITLNDALGDDPATPLTYTMTIDALPTVTSTSPATGGQGATSQNVVITGTGFVNGTGLAASFSGTGITVNSTTYTSATSVTANVTIASGATTGARDVTVTNPDTGAGTGTGKFTVNAKPTVTAASPTSRGQGATSQTITITGTGFVSGGGLAASFSGTGIAVNATTFVSATSVTANINIAAGATTGARDVSVTNPDGGTGTGVGQFTVNAGPSVTSASPASLPRGATSQSVVITGSGFITGAVATFSGTGITVNSTTVNSSTQITTVITITAGATVGARNVTITNSDTGVGTGTGVFTVNALPVLTKVAPATHTRNITGLSVVLTGSGFVSGATVQLVATAGTAPTITATTWNSATKITITITVPNLTSTDNVIITNPDGGTVTKVGGFKST